MASGHVNRKTGRTHGCTDQRCNVKENPCQPGAVHTGHFPDMRSCRCEGCLPISSGLSQSGVDSEAVISYVHERTMNACTAYVYAVARAYDRGNASRKDAAGAILYAGEKATQMALEAIQTRGAGRRFVSISAEGARRRIGASPARPRAPADRRSSR